ncbi:hypothetical protein [Haematobacter massiliensis]|uniref:hypothetical protein n=1 Tax=Haematobacter massiliensis TaxID=195105 RepID=UPI0023F25728|nr:hypothetical protein [Haematobacter massiliensis]
MPRLKRNSHQPGGEGDEGLPETEPGLRRGDPVRDPVPRHGAAHGSAELLAKPFHQRTRGLLEAGPSAHPRIAGRDLMDERRERIHHLSDALR